MPTCHGFEEVARATTLPVAVSPVGTTIEEVEADLLASLRAGPNVTAAILGPEVLFPGADQEPKASAASLARWVQPRGGLMLVVEDRGVVRVVRIDRPAVKNAVDGTCAAALADAFRAFDDDENARVAVLTGTGNFCAGADLKAFSNRLEDAGDGPMGPSRMRLAKPVIAAIEGHAVAGGLSWPRGATSASSRATRPLASFVAASGCPSSTAAPCGCRA